MGISDLIITIGTIATLVGLVPRMGPGRAIWIAIRSRFAFKPKPESLRMNEIKLLRKVIADKDFGQSYVVIMGERGVGKTCLLNSVISKTPGVIRVKAYPWDSDDAVIKNTFHELTRLPNFIHPFNSAKRVIFWYRCFTFGRSPIVVIDVIERDIGRPYASLTSAVRSLVENYKLRVVVTGTPNSICKSLLRTYRQHVFEIQPMTKEMIWKMEQLEELFKYIKLAEMEDIVFAVLGGIPKNYQELWFQTRMDLKAGQNPRQVIGNYLCHAISDAIYFVKKSCGNDFSAIAKLMTLFQETQEFNELTLVTNKLHGPIHDCIFNEADHNRVHVLVPASNAIGIVLKYGLLKEPTLNELEELLKM